jgi:hypothetical protein
MSAKHGIGVGVTSVATAGAVLPHGLHVTESSSVLLVGLLGYLFLRERMAREEKEEVEDR